MKLLELYKEKIMGAISGLDRIRFRGSIRWLATHTGISVFLSSNSILLKDFEAWVMERTANIRQNCDQQAMYLGIETIYLNSSRINKEEMARKIAVEKDWNKVLSGLVRQMCPGLEMDQQPEQER